MWKQTKQNKHNRERGLEGLTGKVVFLQRQEGWKKVNDVDIRWRRVSGRENSKGFGTGVCLTKSRNSEEAIVAGIE